MDSINHVVLRCPNPTMCGMHTNRHHVCLQAKLASVLKRVAKTGSAHPLLVWMPAVMRDSRIRGYNLNSQKASHEPFQT
eukprot:896719-Pelagomonas_calceolata.AAC.1